MSATPLGRPVISDATTDHKADDAAIRQIIANVQAGYNANDAELMNVDIAANASVGNAVGVQFDGVEAILDISRKGLAAKALKPGFAHYEVTDVTFLREDVAIAHKQAKEADQHGEPIESEPSMRALYVLVREDGQWWIAARQNTLIPKEERPR